MAFLEVDSLSYVFPGAQPVEALRDISFDANENEFVSIIGPSGCGKSTLLRLIADLLPVSSGMVLIDGNPSMVARRNRDIGFVFQEPALMPWRSSVKNVRLPLEMPNKARRRTDGPLVTKHASTVGRLNPISWVRDRRARVRAAEMRSQQLLALVG